MLPTENMEKTKAIVRITMAPMKKRPVPKEFQSMEDQRPDRERGFLPVRRKFKKIGKPLQKKTQNQKTPTTSSPIAAST